LFAVLAAVPAITFAQPAPQTLSVQTAVRQAATNNPSLQAALLDEQSADSLVSSAEDQYPLMLQFDVGATHLRNPRLANPGVTTATSDNIVLGSELAKQFPWGTNLGFRVEGSWLTASSQLFPGSDQVVEIGPGYGLSARLTIVQPILQGAGTDVGEAEVRLAHIDRTRAVKAKDRVASELLRDVLVAYWELWYAGEAVTIDTAARKLAEDERKLQQARIDAGSVPPVEIYPFETRVAELDEALLVSTFERQRRAMELGLRLGKPGNQSRHLATDGSAPPAPTTIKNEDDLVAEAMNAAPELAEIDAQLAQSEEQKKTAGEGDRHRLDVTGWAQMEGLGNQEVPPAFEQFAKFGAFSAYLGLVYQFPLTGSRHSKQQRAASKAYDAAVARRKALEQRIENDLTVLVNRANAASQRATLALRTVATATKQRAAAKERFELGDGVAIEIQRAEDTIRRAKLRAARARVDWVLAMTAIDHLTGRLLNRHSGLIPKGVKPQAHGEGTGPL
jgi:outer membrane protein TolC